MNEYMKYCKICKKEVSHRILRSEKRLKTIGCTISLIEKMKIRCTNCCKESVEVVSC